MNSYIQIKRDADASYKKLRVLWAPDAPFPFATVQGRQVTRTLTGALSKEVGKSFKVARGVFKVLASEDAGYASLADLQTFMASDTLADHDLQLIDHNGGAAIAVTFISDFVPLPQIPDMAGSGAFYYVQFEMESR